MGIHLNPSLRKSAEPNAPHRCGEDTGKYSGLSPAPPKGAPPSDAFPDCSSDIMSERFGESQQRPCVGLTPNFHNLSPLFNCLKHITVVFCCQ